MKKNKRPVWLLGLAAVFLAAGIALSFSDYLKREKPQEYNESLAEQFAQTETETARHQEETEGEPAYISPIQFEELKKINPDIVGWIKVEDTVIDYPIVQTDDNETYLETDFEGKKSVAGTIYLDSDCEPDFSGRHNIIYGHHMKNGSMFKDIVKYKDEAFFKEHQRITVYTPEREYHLKPVSAIYTDASPIRRKTIFNTDESFLAYTNEMVKGCPFLQMPEDPIGQLWSFVTCSYEFDDARTILYACEVSAEK